MSRIDPFATLKQWLRWLVAAVAIIVFLFFVGRLIGWIPEKSEICTYNQYYRKDDCPRYDTALVAVRQIIEVFNYASPTIGVLAAIAVAVFTAVLWMSTEKLWEASKEQFAAEHRPWVGVEIGAITQDVIVRALQINVIADAIITNYGNLPAIDTIVEFKSIDFGHVRDMEKFVYDTIKKLEMDCARLINESQRKALLPRAVIFPGNSGGEHCIGIERPKIVGNVETGQVIVFDSIVIGVCCYRSPIESILRYTSFVYRVSVTPSVNIPLNEMGMAPKPIPKENVKFQRWFYGWTAT